MGVWVLKISSQIATKLDIGYETRFGIYTHGIETSLFSAKCFYYISSRTGS